MKKNSIFIDIAILLFVLSLGILFFTQYDVYELFYNFSRIHEAWNLDDIILVFPLLLLCSLILLFFRLRELRVEITKRKIAEEKARNSEIKIEDSLKMKDQFMSVVSHELRTPLNGVIGVLNILEDEDIPDEAKNLVHLALERGRDLDRLIDDILFFVRVEKSQYGNAVTEFDLKSVILSIYDLLLPLSKKKNLEMPRPNLSSLPECIIGIESGFRHILLNLGENAIKFTEKGSIYIRARYESETDTTGQLILEVEDTGIGISAEDQQRVFEPFMQLDSSLTRKKEGVGLGLSLVKELVQASQGSLILTSQQGKGSLFHIEIPVILPQ